MKRLRSRRRIPTSVCFCDACARVTRCDPTAKLDQARQQNFLRHPELLLR